MSLGGFNGALSDRGGSYRNRAQTMAVLLATGAVAAAMGTVVRGHLAVTLVATFTVAFLASVLRVWGNAGISVGVASLTTFVVALAIPASHPGEAAIRAGFLVLGGLWSMAIALVLWPLRPYRPARLAIAACFDALAQYVDQVAESVQKPHTAEWPVQAGPPAITTVRSALEEARLVLVQLRRGRPGTVDRGERLLVLEESCDQLFAHVVAFVETLATPRGDARNETINERAVDALHAVAETARAIAAGVEVEDRAVAIPVSWNGDALRAAMREQGVNDPQYEHAAQILDRIAQFASAASATVEALNGGQPDPTALAAARLSRAEAGEDVSEDTSLVDSLRAMLSPGSLIVQFALRVAVVTTIAVAITEIWELNRGYWVTITVIVILQPYTGVTLTRAVQRVAGTVLGALLAAGLGAYFHDSLSVLVIATIFVACCVALMPLNYAAFSVFLTPTFVLLAEASAGEWNLAGTRVANTLIGGALALVGARLLWPSPEQTRFPSYVGAALRASKHYLETVVDHFDDRSAAAGEAMRAARRGIGVATVNAEESLQRALTEVHGDESSLAPALTFLAYTRRITASTAALAIARHAADGTRRAALEPFRQKAASTLADLASALDEGRAPRPLPPIEARHEKEPISPLVRARVDRLARQIATLHDAVARIAVAGVATQVRVPGPERTLPS